MYLQACFRDSKLTQIALRQNETLAPFSHQILELDHCPALSRLPSGHDVCLHGQWVAWPSKDDDRGLSMTIKIEQKKEARRRGYL